jgi:hypothetical protein
MHFAHCVALPGHISESFVQQALDEAMEPFSEHDDENEQMHWDWFVVGGRWGGSWILKPGAPDGPLSTDPSTFGMRSCDKEGCDRIHTDCARLGNLEPESLHPPYSYLGISGDWHTKWLGPDGSGTQEVAKWEIDDEVWSKQWLTFVQNQAESTWFVLVDYHG